jgi:ribose/xylose/arabinose/galactoside ABC-type transport system permease subunit
MQKIATDSTLKIRSNAILEKGGLGLTLVVIAIVLTALTHGLFITTSNILNILVQSSLTGIVSIGMTFVILTSGIDLSVSGVTVFCSLVGAMLMTGGFGWIPSLLIMLLLGSFIGLINGIAITKLKMVPFVTTLALMNITRGLGKTISNGKTIFGLPPQHAVFGQASVLGIPVAIIILLLFTLAGYIILNYTSFGRMVYAIGGNERAAWLAGIRTDKIVTITYVISGLCAAFGAILITSRLMSASSSIAVGLELDAVAACVIGGTSLFGGEGGIIGTILGAIAISMINNGLNLLGVTPFVQEIAKGIIIFIVIAIDAIRRTNMKRS